MILEINKLTKSYQNNLALNDVSCSFTEGIYGLLGPNGAGKSTLMNIIVNNLEQNSGEILLDGVDIRTLGASYRDFLGFMPQQQVIFDTFTGRRFLSYMAVLKGMDRKKSKERIEEVLEMVNLMNDADNKLGSYSGGMKQRILIAQAILNDPKILILDEPTAGLDPKERIRIRNLISKISLHKIVIIATHVVQDIEFIANEVLLLRKGTLLAKMPPQDLQRSLHNKVYELNIKEHELDRVAEQWRISSMRNEYNEIITRIISDVIPSEYEYKQVVPSIEDLYLYLFDEKNDIDPKVLEFLRGTDLSKEG